MNLIQTLTVMGRVHNNPRLINYGTGEALIGEYIRDYLDQKEIPYVQRPNDHPVREPENRLLDRSAHRRPLPTYRQLQPGMLRQTRPASLAPFGSQARLDLLVSDGIKHLQTKP